MLSRLIRISSYPYRLWYYKLEQAAEQMHKTGEFVNLQLMQNQKLQLYALYKQATQGDAKQGRLTDCEDNPMTSESRQELNKYLAWKMYQGKSKQQAKEEYVQMVKQLFKRHGYDAHLQL